VADEREHQGELAFKRIVFLPIGRIVHPSGVQLAYPRHSSTPLARLKASSISRLAVFCASFTNTRKMTPPAEPPPQTG
jgi:hypothetical protein